MTKEAKIIPLEPSATAYWKYTCPDGDIAIYMPNGGLMTTGNDVYLLERAKAALMQELIVGEL